MRRSAGNTQTGSTTTGPMNKAERLASQSFSFRLAQGQRDIATYPIAQHQQGHAVVGVVQSLEHFSRPSHWTRAHAQNHVALLQAGRAGRPVGQALNPYALSIDAERLLFLLY